MLRRTLFTTAIVTGIFAIPLRTEPVAAQSPAPPAVLVQPATARSLTVQSEYIGRVKAREKVELRARVGASSDRGCSRTAIESKRIKSCSRSSANRSR